VAGLYCTGQRQAPSHEACSLQLGALEPCPSLSAVPSFKNLASCGCVPGCRRGVVAPVAPRGLARGGVLRQRRRARAGRRRPAKPRHEPLVRAAGLRVCGGGAGGGAGVRQRCGRRRRRRRRAARLQRNRRARAGLPARLACSHLSSSDSYFARGQLNREYQTRASCMRHAADFKPQLLTSEAAS